MSVLIEFQGPDYNDERNPLPDVTYDRGVNVQAAGFDLDFGMITIYPRGEDLDMNLRLAVRSPYMNEDGRECGSIGWLIDPEDELLTKQPEIREHVGKRYGRVIVVAR